MRAKEFTINIPINIRFNGDGDPEVDVPSAADDQPDLHQNPVMVSPLQQQLELHKAALGKDSPVIDKLTVVASDDVGQEPQVLDAESQLLDRIKTLLSR